jgi:nitroreductase
MLEAAYRIDHPEPGRLEIEAVERFAHQAPELVVALSSPTPGHKIPVWEQQLSCGAALMNLLLAAHAMGYAAGWVTGWAAYSDAVLAAFGAPPERIAGFVFLGTPAAELEERLRPEYDEVASRWTPPVA